MASSQAGSIGGTKITRKFREEETVSLKSSPTHRGSQTQRKQDVTVLPKKVSSNKANTDKNYGPI